MTLVYVPYWAFQASTRTHWTGDTSNTPAGARGDWYPLFGSTLSFCSGLLIRASSALTPKETRALCPFDLTAQVIAMVVAGTAAVIAIGMLIAAIS